MNWNRLLLMAGMVMLLALGARPSAAAVILSKALNTAQFGWNSNQPPNAQQSTDDVQLGAGATVDRIEWYGFRGDGTTSFRIRFFEGVVENAVTSHFYEDDVIAQAVDTGLDSGGGDDIFLYSADVADVALAAGTRYELSIMSLENEIWTWNHSDPEGGNLLYHRNGDLDSWREIGGQTRDSHAFTLFSADVPEPATLALMGLGIAGIGYRRRRQSS